MPNGSGGADTEAANPVAGSPSRLGMGALPGGIGFNPLVPLLFPPRRSYAVPAVPEKIARAHLALRPIVDRFLDRLKQETVIQLGSLAITAANLPIASLR
jgi:hypothetical protein